MNHKDAITKIEEHLHGFFRAMEQRQEWLDWAAMKKCTDADNTISHNVQIVRNEAEVNIMEKIISLIRSVIERIDEPLTEKEAKTFVRGGFPCPTCGANPPRNACPTKCDEYH
jgi:hypothetical protein